MASEAVRPLLHFARLGGRAPTTRAGVRKETMVFANIVNNKSL